MKVGVVLEPHGIHGLVQPHFARLARQEVDDADALQPVLALDDDQVALEGFDRVDLDIGPVRDDLAPCRSRRVARRSFEHAEVERVLVGQDEKQLAGVGDVVFDLGFARLHDLEHRRPGFVHRVVEARCVHLGGGVALHDDEDVLAAACHFETHEEGGVGFAIQLDVAFNRPSEGVAPHRVRPHLLVEDRIEEGMAVVAPLDVVREAANGTVHDGARRQIHHEQLERFAAGGVDGVREQAMVGARLARAEGEVRVAFCERVFVEQNLFRCFHGDGVGRAPATVDVVLPTLFGARVVEVFVALDRHRRVGFVQPRQHLVVERLLEVRGRRQHGVGVFVLGAQIGDDVGVGALA